MKFLQNIEPREYQEKIFQTCKEKNCLVVLPTGLGKTLIALMLTIHRMGEFPGKKVVFLAPTKPLAEQHLETFKKHLSELFGDLQLFTGAVKPEQRKKIWQTADIIFSTPQCVANDIRKNIYDLSNVCLLIQDEAHRCVKNYDYNYLAQEYKKQSSNPRIIGMTASPGNDTSRIKEICKNLFIEEVELRTRESEDVKKYLQELEFKKILVDFPEELGEIRSTLNILFEQYVEELKRRMILFGPANKTTLIELQKKISATISRGNKNFNYMLGASACAQAIKLQHALELLETQTIESFNKYLKNILNQASKQQSKGVVKLVAKPEFNFIFMLSNELLAKNKEHPKLEEVDKIIKNEIKENPALKIIIFTQFRDTASIISKKLNKIKGIISKVFVGQATVGADGIKGLSQKEQKQIIQEFTNGEINILCATSLHPDEDIILREKGQIKIKTISEFVDSFLDEKESSKKITGWEILSTDGKKTFFKPITHIHKHKSKDNLIKLKLNSGFEVRITDDHELFTFEQGKEFVKTSPKLNQFIALPMRCQNIQKEQIIDLEKELKNANLNNVKKHIINLTQSKIRILKTDFKILAELNKKELDLTNLTKFSKKDYSTTSNSSKRLLDDKFISQKIIKQNNKKLSKITLLGKKYLKSLKWLLDNIKYSKGKYLTNLSEKTPKDFDKFFDEKINVIYGKTHFPKKIKLTKELAEFLGFYVSEGHTRKTKKTSGIFLASQNEKIQKLMQNSIKKGLNINPSINKNGVAIYSQLAHYLIEHVFKAGIGSYKKEVPNMIFTAKNEIKWAFLKAYFLGDGYWSENRIVMTTTSKKLITGLIFLLRTLGVQKITLQKQQHIYKLNIYESLPFAKLKEKNPARQKGYYSLIPTSLNSKNIFEKNSNFYSPNKKTRKIGKWKNDICYDYIKEIKKEKNINFVYDITVKDTKNFIGGTGPICLHNCIAEEGLDIPEVNAVIFYEPIASAIRTIQRSGRTARLKPGKLIMLITKNTRDESFFYVARSREKKMKKAIEEIKESFAKGNKLEFQKELK